MSEVTGNGKIERLPWELREEVCRRLRDGVPAGKICDWLNSMPEVLRILDEHFGEQPINAQNVTNFRQGGYQRWLAKQGRLDRVRELAAFSVDAAKAAGGSLADGAAQILAGNILEVLEGLDDLTRRRGDAEGEQGAEQATAMAEAIQGLTLAVSRLRRGDQNAEALRVARERLAQGEKQLALEKEKFQRLTCKLFLQWRDDDRARHIADGPGTSEEKVERLGQAMFGDLWK